MKNQPTAQYNVHRVAYTLDWADGDTVTDSIAVHEAAIDPTLADLRDVGARLARMVAAYGSPTITILGADLIRTAH